MNYTEFKDAFVDSFQDYLPAQYQDWEVRLLETVKVNGCYDTVVVMPPDGMGGSPNLYVEELFEYYVRCKDFQKVCRKAASIFVMGMDYISKLGAVPIVDLPEDRIIFSLIPQEDNERLLADTPHRLTMDLAVIYRVLLDAEDGGFDSTMITNDIAEAWKLTEERLYELALENTPEILPLEVIEQDGVFSILTNERHTLGAASMLYPGALKDVADKIETDLFILPASMHEVFVVPDMGQDVLDMHRIVADANMYLSHREEYLADHAYYYHKETDQVCIPKWE